MLILSFKFEHFLFHADEHYRTWSLISKIATQKNKRKCWTQCYRENAEVMICSEK